MTTWTVQAEDYDADNGTDVDLIVTTSTDPSGGGDMLYAPWWGQAVRYDMDFGTETCDSISLRYSYNSDSADSSTGWQLWQTSIGGGGTMLCDWNPVPHTSGTDQWALSTPTAFTGITGTQTIWLAFTGPGGSRSGQLNWLEFYSAEPTVTATAVAATVDVGGFITERNVLISMGGTSKQGVWT